MFGWSVDKEEIKTLRSNVESLFKEKQKLREDLEELKLKKRLEQEEITHMIRINEEKNKQELENDKIRLEREYNEKISKFREEQTASLLTLNKELHGKLEGRFNVELGNLKEIY